MADFGQMINQCDAKFGKILFGVDSIQDMIAETANKRHGYFKRGVRIKEHFDVPALLCGMSTGKSTMLERHLEVIRTRCSDPDLKNMLSNHPLVLNVTFNSSMTFITQETKISK